jgi:hypothetical protein
VNARFACFVLLSAGVHGYVLWAEAPQRHPPTLPLMRGEISVEIVASAPSPPPSPSTTAPPPRAADEPSKSKASEPDSANELPEPPDSASKI